MKYDALHPLMAAALAPFAPRQENQTAWRLERAADALESAAVHMARGEPSQGAMAIERARNHLALINLEDV